MENMDEWNYFLDKKIVVIYEDGKNHFSKKEGWIIDKNTTHLIIRNDAKTEAINISKILRMEVKE